MSGTFWKFGNGYNDKSVINELLEKGFIRQEKRDGNEEQEAFKQHRKGSTSTQSSDETSDADDISSSRYNEDETIEDEESESQMPNLEILDQLLDEQDILEELAGSNLKLIEYLRHHDVLEQLVTYVITENANAKDEEAVSGEKQEQEQQAEGSGSDNGNDDSADEDDDGTSSTTSSADSVDTPEKIHARRAQVSAEILSLDVWSLTDSFMDNHDLLRKLWTLLDKPCPLSMIESTYFMKINEHLLDMKLHGMLNFLLQQNDLVDRFLRHIDNPPLMDFLLKVISTDKPDNPTGIIEILKEQELIPKLVEFLDPEIGASVQSAAGDFIKAFVTISANSNTDNSTIGPNELTRELLSEKVMERLCELMLHGGTSLANGVGIMIEIIRKNNSDYDFVPVLYITIESHPPTSRDPIYLGHLIKVFSRNIPKFTKLLEETKLDQMETPFGTIEPLGFERFKICELIAELLHCSNMGLLNDESGEDIVRERDIERERIIALEREQKPQESQNPSDNDDAFDHEMSREIKRLSIASNDDSKDKSNSDDQIKLETEESEIETDTELDDESKVSKTNLESESDSNEETADAFRYDENEANLREDPVAGDQLKISLADNKVILLILNMFFRFPWNNFLHNVVFDIVQQILNGSMEIGYNKYLAIDLFGRGQITKLIIDGQENCDKYEKEHGLRLGYMGHLTLIAEEVVKFTALYLPSSIHQVVLDAVSAPEWTVYVTETLVETREKYNALLGGEAEEEDDDEKKGFELDPSIDHDIAGLASQNDAGDNEEEDEEDTQGDQFSRYMSQQMTNDLPDKFGSSDEDDEEDDVSHQGYHPASQYMSMDDDDDYEDPNDDGQSYQKKNHPLYHDLISPTDERGPPPSHSGYDDDDSSSDSDDEDVQGPGLMRSTSHELDWDDDEQNRLINMASYIKSHQ